MQFSVKELQVIKLSHGTPTWMLGQRMGISLDSTLSRTKSFLLSS